MTAAGFALVSGLALAQAGDEPSVRESTTYSDLKAATESELRDALDRAAVSDPSGKRFYGSTEWTLRWNFRVISDGRECRLDAASAELDVRMRLPRWTPPPRAPKPLAARWNAFAAALRAHEAGHREIAIEAAHEVLARVRDAKPARECDALKKALSKTADATVAEYRSRERRYDEDTEHGRKQGAVFR